MSTQASNEKTGNQAPIAAATNEPAPVTGRGAADSPDATQSAIPNPIPSPPLGISEESKKLYADYIAEISKRELSGSENYDKAILTLSSTGLGISLAFLKDHLTESPPIFAGALYGSWALFVAAITFTLLSFSTSGKALGKQRDFAYDFYLLNNEEAFTASSIWGTATKLLNLASGLAFVSALILTIVFVWANTERKTMSNETLPQNPATERRGAPVPPMPRTSAPAPAPTPVTKGSGPS